MSAAQFAGSPENTGDLYASLDAYFTLHLASMEPQFGAPSGNLAKRTSLMLNTWYKKSFPAIFRKLEQLANDNGESTRRGSKAGRYATMLFELQDYLEAIGAENGYLEPKSSPNQPSPNSMNMEQLMQQMPAADTVRQ
jgi:hypothetical protein